MSPSRPAVPTLPNLEASVAAARVRADDKIDPLHRPALPESGWTTDWLMALLAAALMVAALAYGIAVVYPLLFQV